MRRKNLSLTIWRAESKYFFRPIGNVPIVRGLCLVGFSMWDLHHREWLLSSLEARAAPSRQHSNLYLSAGLSVYINCDFEIQTSFSLHAVPGHKKSYFHYSTQNKQQFGERRPLTLIAALWALLLRNWMLKWHNTLDFFSVIFLVTLAFLVARSLRAFSSVCPMYALPRCCVCLLCVPLFTWSERWVRVCHLALCMCVVLAQSTRAGRGKRPLAALAGCLHRTNTRCSQTQLLRLNVFNRTVDVQRGEAHHCVCYFIFSFCERRRKTSPWVRV